MSAANDDEKYYVRPTARGSAAGYVLRSFVSLMASLLPPSLSHTAARSGSAARMSSAPVPCSTQVAGASTPGAASLEGDVLVWRPAADGVKGERSVPLSLITGHQRNKPGAARASLRLVLGEPKPGAKPTALVLQFAAEGDRDALSDAIKARLAASAGSRPSRPPPGATSDPAPGPSAAERAARAALLQSNPELAALHGRLVRGSPHAAMTTADPSDPSASSAAVTDEEFWSARTHLFRDAVAKAGATQRPGLANALDADVKGARDGRGDVVTATLSNEKMHRIFSERPSVRRAFLENVPSKMTEREFWTRFLRSEYFKAARAGAPPQGEEEAADLALFSRKPQTREERKATAASVSASVNLASDADDFGVFGSAAGADVAVGQLGVTEGEGARGGHGILRDGAKEPPPPSGALAAATAGVGGSKAAAARHAAREVLQSLNHHAEVVLRGRPAGAITDARSAALAAEAQERAGGAAAALARAGKREERAAAGGADGADEDKHGDDDDDVRIVDLIDAPRKRMKVLSIADPQQYFAANGGEKDGEGEGVRVARPAGSKGNDGDRMRTRATFADSLRRTAAAMGLTDRVRWAPGFDVGGAGGAALENPTAKRIEIKSEGGDEAGAVVVASAGVSGAGPNQIQNQNQSSASISLLTPAAARSVLDEITASVRRANANAAGDRGWGSAANLAGMGAGGSEEGEEDGGVDSETRAAVAADAAAAAELLRHFWLAAPMVTAARWDRAARVNVALGTLYDRLEARKRALPPAGRHAVAGRLRPLAQAMDSAFAYYDDEKIRRAASYEAFEKTRGGAGGGGGADAPIEIS